MFNTIDNNDLLIRSTLGEKLFYGVAQNLPVIDYHNHLNPENIATNKQFNNIAEAWVLFDPYKHRAMRICGIPEAEITGTATDKVKFINWAKTLPKTIGNPLYLWSAMELKAVFDIDVPLNQDNANEIWDFCNRQLEQPGNRAVDILKKFNAEIVCTSDDLLDNLTFQKDASTNQGIRVFPSLRGDTVMAFDTTAMVPWLRELSEQCGVEIKNMDDYKSAIIQKLGVFGDAGSKMADHSLDGGFQFVNPSESRATLHFNNWLKGKVLDEAGIIQLRNYMLQFLSEEYAQRGWVLQLHLGAHRNTSSRLRKLAGPGGGYGAIGKSCDIDGLVRYLDALEAKGKLPKIILYTLNPNDNESFATITGSFTEDGVPGKIQFGPAWWYNDHYAGIKRHLESVSSYGLLSQFIGMTTDSRSVFSFSRHEYFRKILCGQIAEMVKSGLLPEDESILADLVQDISYYNSKKWIFNE